MVPIKIRIEKIGLNPDSDVAMLANDFSFEVIDQHPNVKKGDVRDGIVSKDTIVPLIGENYTVHRDTGLFSTSKIVKIFDIFTFMTRNSVYNIKLLDRIINFSYNVTYHTVNDFEFDKKNEIVDLTNYQKLTIEVLRLVDVLNKTPDSRQAVTILANNENPSCLISLQYLIHNKTLCCVASYRSQHARFGYPHDIRMLRYLTTLFIENSKNKFANVDITVNVADFHDYDELEQIIMGGESMRCGR